MFRAHRDGDNKLVQKYGTLRVHVPHHYVLGPYSPHMGGAVRPKSSLLRYMDPKP